jgi:hypothetical protein
LFFGRDISQFYIIISYFFTDKIILYLNILNIVIKQVILGQGNSVLVVAINNNNTKPWI